MQNPAHRTHCRFTYQALNKSREWGEKPQSASRKYDLAQVTDRMFHISDYLI